MIDLSFLSKSEVEHLDEQIGFTEIEKEIIEHLVKNDLNDDGIMLELHLSRNKYYKIKLNAVYKIIRYAANNQILHYLSRYRVDTLYRLFSFIVKVERMIIMSEWDNPVERKWITPKKDLFTTMCNEIYTMGYNDGLKEAEKELDNE